MLLDLIHSAGLDYNLAALTILNVIQNGMAGTKLNIQFRTNAALCPEFPTSVPGISVEFSLDGGATWPIVETIPVSYNFNGVSQIINYTSTQDCVTGIRTRMRWYCPYAREYSPYTSVDIYAFDYFDPATIFPTYTQTDDYTITFSGSIPSLNVPAKRFEYVSAAAGFQSVPGWSTATINTAGDPITSIQGFKCF